MAYLFKVYLAHTALSFIQVQLIKTAIHNLADIDLETANMKIWFLLTLSCILFCTFGYISNGCFPRLWSPHCTIGPLDDGNDDGSDYDEDEEEIEDDEVIEIDSDSEDEIEDNQNEDYKSFRSVENPSVVTIPPSSSSHLRLMMINDEQRTSGLITISNQIQTNSDTFTLTYSNEQSNQNNNLTNRKVDKSSCSQVVSLNHQQQQVGNPSDPVESAQMRSSQATIIPQSSTSTSAIPSTFNPHSIDDDPIKILPKIKQEILEDNWKVLQNFLSTSTMSNDENCRYLDDAPVDTTPSSHSIGQSHESIVRQSARIASKRKQTEEEEEVQQQQPQKDTEKDKTEDNEKEDEKVTSGSVKRSRQSLSTTSSSTKQEQVITLALLCPQADCKKMIVMDQFVKHMKDHHSLGPYLCFVKHCGQSFDNRRAIGRHLAECHQSNTEWQCAKCDHTCGSYARLSSHDTKSHQIGLFRCSAPLCTFTKRFKYRVHEHYKVAHKPRVMKHCPEPGCQFQTWKGVYLKKHKLVHLDIRPYKCKWTDCHYTAKSRETTILHIRQKHFKRKLISRSRLEDYVEVNQVLLDDLYRKFNATGNENDNEEEEDELEDGEKGEGMNLSLIIDACPGDIELVFL